MPVLRFVRSIHRYSILMLSGCVFCCLLSGAQDTNTKESPTLTSQLSARNIDAIGKKYESIKEKLFKHSRKTLRRLQKQEAKLKRKMAGKDSLAAKQLFAQGDPGYQQLQRQIGNDSLLPRPSLKNYVPGIDSIQTAFKWMKQPAMASLVQKEQLDKIGAASKQIASLQQQLQSTAAVQDFIKQRKAQLQQAFEKMGMAKELAAFKKEAYYYQAQVNEYKELLNDPDKLVKKALALASQNPAFKSFMQNNSMLAQLFPVPNGYGTAQALQGLQTRAAIQQQLGAQLAAGGPGAQQYLQQQVQAAQTQMNQLKDKVNQLGGGSSDLEMPEFKPNSQHTKSFLKRIEYGINIQSQRPNGLLPVTSDLALTAGYKLNDKSVIGLGAGYKMGWGKNLSNIHITSEGLSLRSYLDIKWKGGFWISGGYEYNYQQAFSSIDQLKNLSAWQKSGLIGITKKYKVGKKKGNMQLLWDFLSYSQLPQTQPLKFRIGYTL